MSRIALLGAARQIGTPLSLLCKHDLFDEISLYNLVHVPGIATVLNHVDTRAKVTGYLAAEDGLQKALTDADINVVTAGIARKPDMTRDHHPLHLHTIATTCPTAIFCVVTKPVNLFLPVAAETLEKAGVSGPRAFEVPVVGGHSGATILPLYNQAGPSVELDGEVLFIAHIYLPAIPGGKQISAELGIGYFAVSIVLGGASTTKTLPIREISEREKELLEVAVRELKGNIETGLAFAGALRSSVKSLLINRSIIYKDVSPNA
ncbi:uncharacterized protein EURHEDRAFT_516239 [Aspergillus ruber CBS 135680]|uniref:malate dehydrogenase n=1 Tax=Aspergillus ruber (strain CBS 135680) TaxID=1388766 RepID=A0A017SA82_ASPRC|nr:uncharacterized protein EURHEDRAFT_516239 [Aspergillus ruber CBS 135680]EYE93963.1 hypothetical protein EURHEDRAFT_516239 [Aspergillus ruber CBS 135680]